MRKWIARLWNMRRSPRPAVRLAWWGIALCLGAGVIASEGLRAAAIGLWITANVVLALVASGWGFVHPRVVLRGQSTALKWAFWLALPATLGILGGLDSVLAMQVHSLPIPTSALLAISGVALWPLMFFLMAFFGLLGAALGAFAGRKELWAGEAAKAGAGAWWLALLGVILLEWVAHRMPGALTAALYGGVPLFMVGILRLTQRSAASALSPAQRLMNGLAHWLVWRWKFRGRPRRLDLRGVALGLVAAVLLLAADSQNLLAPLQSSALVSLLQLRAALPQSDMPSEVPLDDAHKQKLTISRPAASKPPPVAQDRMVLLEMDASARHAALTNRSEAALQAEMIRRLSAWGAARVVLPLPLLHTASSDENSFARMARQNIPLPAESDVARSRKDLPDLLTAMRAAGNVVLAVPEQPRLTIENSHHTAREDSQKQEAFRAQLEGAAREAGLADLGSFHTIRLISIPTQWKRWAPLPILLAADLNGTSPSVQPAGSNAVTIAGTRESLIAPKTLLPEFSERSVVRPFPRVPYSSLLRTEPIYAGNSEAPSSSGTRWLPPKQFFQGKVVFLDPLMPSVRETEIGTLPQQEVLADATAALLSGDTLARPDLGLWQTLMLCLGALVGAASARRAPLDALWRVAIVLFLSLAGVIAAFFAQGVWADPVLPLAVSASAFLLATQFTYALEHDERERNRALLQRFVAPQVVDEFLDAPEKLGLGGARRRICVLFADVRNFTGFAEQHTPEEVIDVVNQYMTVMTDALDAYGGILDKYTGDGLMALFPVRTPPQEDVVRSVRAAMAMRDSAEALSTQRIAEGKQPLLVGIGMHYGEAVVGMVGNPIRQINYTALGYTVVISARLQTLAAGGAVIISDSIAAYLESAGAFRLEGGEPVRVKGVTNPVLPYRVFPLPPPLLSPIPEVIEPQET